MRQLRMRQLRMRQLRMRLPTDLCCPMRQQAILWWEIQAQALRLRLWLRLRRHHPCRCRSPPHVPARHATAQLAVLDDTHVNRVVVGVVRHHLALLPFAPPHALQTRIAARHLHAQPGRKRLTPAWRHRTGVGLRGWLRLGIRGEQDRVID